MLSGVTAVSVGAVRNYALKADGSVWSFNYYEDPSPLPGLTDVVAVASGEDHGLFLKGDGTVWSVGFNGWGQLGDGTTIDRSTPVQVPGLTGIVAVGAGDRFSVALKSDGTVRAWGVNTSGELGDGTMTNRISPVQVPGLTSIKAISAQKGHTLAVANDGTVWEWGWNLDIGMSATPFHKPGLSGVTAVDSDWATFFAVKADGSLWTWGEGADGQLGDGSTAYRTNPARVTRISGVTAANTGPHGIAMKADGSAWAWGGNQYGSLGDGTLTGRYVPGPVPGLTGVTAVAAGNRQTFAVADPALAPAQDAVALDITGGITYRNSGNVQSGNLTVLHDQWGPNRVSGSATMPGANGGTATITVDVNRFWILSLYLGSVRITDASSSLNLTHFDLFGTGRSMSPNIAVMTSSSANFASLPWGQQHRMDWTIHDLA